MTMVDTGMLGAKRVSWRHGNPREMLKRIIDELGTSDRDRLLREFNDQVFARGNRAVLESIVEYWFANNLNSLLDRSALVTTRKRLRTAAQKRTAEVRQEIITAITVAAGVMLLDIDLPHGKKLRDSTGAECSAIGGWLAVVGAKVLPDVIVGNVLNEDDVRALFERVNGTAKS